MESMKNALQGQGGTHIFNQATPTSHVQRLTTTQGGLQSVSTAVGETIAGQSDTRGSSQKQADDASASIGEMSNPNSKRNEGFT